MTKNVISMLFSFDYFYHKGFIIYFGVINSWCHGIFCISLILHYLTPFMYFFEWLPELKNNFKYTHQQSCNLFVRKEMVLKWFFDAIGISSLNTFCNQKIVQVRLCSCSFNRMTDNFISSERVAQSASKVRVFFTKLLIVVVYVVQ